MKKKPIAAYFYSQNSIVYIHDEWEEMGRKRYRTCEGIREPYELAMIYSFKRLGEFIDKGVSIAPSTWNLILQNR